MNNRKITAIVWFFGLIVIATLNNQMIYLYWLLIGAIAMFIETGIDTNWEIEKKVINFFRRYII